MFTVPFSFFSSGERLQKWRKPWFGTEKKHKDVKICMIKFMYNVYVSFTNADRTAGSNFF